MNSDIIKEYIAALERFKQTDGVKGYVSFFDKIKGLDRFTMQGILDLLPKKDLEMIQRLCTIELLNKLIFITGDEEQKRLADKIDEEHLTIMYDVIENAIIENRLRQVEEEYGPSVFGDGDLSPEFVDYLNNIEPRELPEDDEDDQGAFTIRMDAPKVLRAYKTISERLGRALAESLSFQAREYQMALERIREARYAEMELESGYYRARRPGRGMGGR